MLDKNILVRDTIRMFLAEVQKFEIDSKEVADDAKVLQIINKMIKQRNDSIEQFTKGGRDDLVAKELSEVDVLNKYKPAQLSEDQIILRVREAISTSNASSMQDIGKVMGLLKNSLSGSADMGIVSKVVKDQLS
jgi:uncharacterized protein YqeY